MSGSEGLGGSNPRNEVAPLILARDPKNAMEHDHSHLPEYRSSGFNIEGGIRRTLAVAADADRRLLICGGSTVICSDVADDETLPSQLQHRINADKISIRVENWGRWGSTAENRCYFLRHVARPRAGDVVVVYFGVNDTGYRLYRHSRGPRGAYTRKLLAVVLRLISALVSRLRSIRSVVRLLVALPLSALLATATASATLRTLRRNRRFWVARGVRFLAILQPNLVDVSQRRGLRDSRIPRNPELLVMNRVAYRIYRRAIRRANLGRGMVDVSACLDGSLGCYLDWAHLDSDGNQFVAGEIFRELQARAILVPGSGTSLSSVAET